MENNDSNIKPQQTGGLKLMTVFIAVLALHVVVIGGFTVYHLMSGGSSDADMLADKTHKGTKAVSDAAMPPESPLPDASATTASTVPTDPTNAQANNTMSPTPTDNSVTAMETGPIASTSVTPTPTSRGPVITPPAVPAKSVASSAPVIAPTPEIQPMATSNGAPYVVKSGDSLAKIARQHGTSVAKLKAANSLSNDMLHIGQKMVIPAKTQIAAVAPVPAPNTDIAGSTPVLGDSTSTTALSAPAPAMKTPTKKIALTQPSSAPAVAGRGHTYTVMKGDTLTRIAHKFKTTPTAIMAANNLTDATKLGIGKKLKIPTLESRSAKNNEPSEQPSPVQAKGETTAQLANFIQ